MVAGLVLLALVVVLGLRLQSIKGPVRVDVAASSEIAQHRSTSGNVAHLGSRSLIKLGDEIPVMIAMGALALWAATRRDGRGMIVALVGPAAAITITEYVLKPLIDRQTTGGALSYPSGHVTAVVAVAAAALLLVYRYEGARIALLWSPVALGAVAAVAFAVVLLRWHYITDSIAGIGLGLGVVLLVAGSVDAARPAPRAALKA